MDTDGDGVITREEFHAAYSSPGSPPPPTPTGGQSWSDLASNIQTALKPYDRFQSGIVKEDVFKKALEQHGVDPRHPGVARMLEYSSDSGHVMYKQFFRDAVNRDKQPSPTVSPSPPQTFSTPLATPSQHTAPPASSGATPSTIASTIDLSDQPGDDRQRLAKSRIAVAELRMEVERLRDLLIDADVERKALEMELSNVRKEARESGSTQLHSVQDKLLAVEREKRALLEEKERDAQLHLGEVEMMARAIEDEKQKGLAKLIQEDQASGHQLGVTPTLVTA